VLVSTVLYIYVLSVILDFLESVNSGTNFKKLSSEMHLTVW
jgi:hypothetical protein